MFVDSGSGGGATLSWIRPSLVVDLNLFISVSEVTESLHVLSILV